MPRETITTRRPRKTIQRKGKPPVEPSPDFDCEVSWARGKFAQIAVHATVPIVELGLDPDMTGLYANLSLDDITRLQAVLRRVKKQLLLPPLAACATADDPT